MLTKTKTYEIQTTEVKKQLTKNYLSHYKISNHEKTKQIINFLFFCN